jgi:hypothetical protein
MFRPENPRHHYPLSRILGPQDRTQHGHFYIHGLGRSVVVLVRHVLCPRCAAL